MGWIADLAMLAFHPIQSTDVLSKTFDCTGPVAEDVIACGHSIFFFEDGADVIVGMACIVAPSTLNVFPSVIAVVINVASKHWVCVNKIRYSTSMITMLMCEYDWLSIN